jgi:hypothetical protein
VLSAFTGHARHCLGLEDKSNSVIDHADRRCRMLNLCV